MVGVKLTDERSSAGSSASMSPWQRLSAELDQWQALGRAATLWWRDDDAETATPALEKLLGLQRRHGVPLALATIPVVVAHQPGCPNLVVG